MGLDKASEKKSFDSQDNTPEPNFSPPQALNSKLSSAKVRPVYNPSLQYKVQGLGFRAYR